ncbi:SET and MYND domain-containing protein 4-like [Cherax quadricarinatus]|uniref:SET and MYND domain-containing protein 4-like n=1 Tax=Cherax quadricarinatus TaxID=27406 RepID=UPI00387E416B
MDCTCSFESLTKKFFRVLLLNNKLLELRVNIRSERTTEEMFSYIWRLDEAQRFLTPVLIPPTKSESVSFMHWREGESAYRIHDLDTALQYYNLAILSAPHPDILADNAEAHDREMYKALAQGYESRSIVLFDLQQYEKCSEDIDRALQLSSYRISCKMLEMKARCMIFISEGKDKTFDASAESLKSYPESFAYTNPKPPKLTEVNPTMPSLSSSVKLAYTPSEGRHLIADKDINPGEIVSVDDGYCNTVFMETSVVHCTVCLRRSMTPIPCPNCNMVIFCSVECRTDGMSGIHWQECPILPTLFALDMKKCPALAYRIMMKTSHAKLKGMIPLLRLEAKKKSPKNHGFNKEGIYDEKHYRSVYHLVTNKEKLSSQELLRKCIQAFIITKLLHLSGRYFLTSDGKPFTPSRKDIILTGSTLVHHMMNLTCNAKAITSLQVNVSISQLHHGKMYGSGIYSASSLMNHSCNPNCSAFFYGKTEVVRAVHFIPAGKQLTISYGEIFTDKSRASRLVSLMTRYHFQCKCEACEHSWQPLSDVSPLPLLKCTNCHEAIDSFTQVCFKCCINYGKNVGKNAAPYNYKLISKKIEKFQDEYQIAKENIFIKGNYSDRDMKVVRVLIKLLCKYMKQPCPLLMDAMNTLCYLFDKRGSCVYYQNDLELPCAIS